MTAPAELSPLTTVPGVELARTGSWAISSGSWTPTREDFHAAVAAHGCPAVRPPVIKLGHVDPRFDGQPAVGSIENLRIEHGGHSLVGDLAGIPTWLANRDSAGHSVLSSAFPSRSVEGMYGYRCQLGHTHPFVLTGLALLGVTPPGVGTLRSLRDIADLYGVTAEVKPVDGGTAVSAVFRAAAEIHTGAMVALVPTVDHAARLAVDGGEPVEQLHLTLAYLGDAIDIGEATRRATITALATAMTGAGTVDADGFAVSVFNPSNDERDTAIVLGVGGSEVDDVQSLAVQTLAKVPGLVVPEQHLPFAAHVTLAYSDDLTMVAKLTDRTGPVSFDRLRVAFGGTVTDIPLGPTAVHARYNPDQVRDPGGEDGGRWTAGPIRDTLRLAGRIDLAPGETLIGSDRLTGDGGAARLALTEQDGTRSLRLGVGGSGFGGREDEAGPWRGGPDRTAAVNAERQALSDEGDALRAEWDQLGGGIGDPARAAAIEARLDELDDMDLGEVYPSGYTARLDLPAVEQLRSTLSEALTAGAALQARMDADDEPERPEQGYFTLAEGSIPGEWADVAYHVYLDDPSVGVEVHLAAVPHADGLTFDDLTGSDRAAVFEPAEARRLLRLLARMAPATDVAATFDPHQRRDGSGQWSDSGLDAPAPAPAETVEAPPGMTWGQVLDLYGDSYDEATAGDFTVAVFDNGDFTLFYRNGQDRFEPLRELTAEDAESLADQLEWAARLDEVHEGGYDETDALIDFMPVDEEQTGIVGYSGDGDVRMAFSNTGDSAPDLTDPDSPDVDSFYLTPDGAVDLADALRDMAARHSELNLDDVSAATADPDALKRWWTTGPGRAKWVGHPHPWRALFSHLRRFMPVDMAKRTTSQWYHDVLGRWPAEDHKKAAAAAGRTSMADLDADRVRAAWNEQAPHEQWITEIAPDQSYVVVVTDPGRTFTRHQVHVSAKGQITFGRGRPIHLGYVDAAGAVTAQRVVYASRAESRPAAAPGPAPQPPLDAPPTAEPPSTGSNTLTTPPPPGGVPVSPAAEPESITEPKEDLVSTDLSAFRSRLGLAEDADDAAVLAAIDVLKTKAETPPPAVEPDTAQVAAAAATAQENTELKKEVAVLASRLDEISGELAATKAATAATVKASVLTEARRLGKFAPADEERWSKDYDDAPAVITRVLASIAPGTAVPVSAAGSTGPAEPDATTNWAAWDAELARLDGPVSTKGN